MLGPSLSHKIMNDYIYILQFKLRHVQNVFLTLKANVQLIISQEF